MLNKTVMIYTDGACKGNPGPGGWAAILLYCENEKILIGGHRNTTNNRMEMTAVIEGLNAIKYPCKVNIYSDSKYIVDAINFGWLKKWIGNNWMRNKSQSVLNVDLWKDLVELLNIHNVSFNWVKGHCGNEYNERCDKLAVEQSNIFK